MGVSEVSIVHHVALVLFLLFILSRLGLCHPFSFFVAFLYLYKVNERWSIRLRRRLQHEERKHASQQRLLSDSESVKWLNRAIEKVWPLCMEHFASQRFLLPIIPWFIDRFKPWTTKKAHLQHLYLGRSPPMFTEVRVLRESPDDDHLLLELGMNFLAADDMSAVIAVKLRKRLGFGIRAKMHVTGMHVEGKILVGVKFMQHWPFLGRLRVCFNEPPYIQITVKPIFHHGIDVAELPGIASWLNKTIDAAFERTLVEPNMLVIDVEKFVSASTESWFSVDVKCPIAFAKVEIVEAIQMQPSDSNGLAYPYVKGQLGPYRFQTKIQRKTLAPKWLEEFKIPITSWEACNKLIIEVRDKEPISDDMLGNCSINITELRGGQRHDKWLALQNVKTGRLRLAITIIEVEAEKDSDNPSDDDEDPSMVSETTSTGSSPMVLEGSSAASSFEVGKKLLADDFEHKNVEMQHKTELWVHHTGDDDSSISWENRKEYENLQECYESPRSATSSYNEASSTRGTADERKGHSHRKIRRGLHKLGLVLHHKNHNSDSRDQESFRTEKHDAESPKDHIKEKAKGIMKQAGKSAHKLKIALKRKVHNKLKEDDESESNESDISDSSNTPYAPCKGCSKDFGAHTNPELFRQSPRSKSVNLAGD